MKLSAEIWEYKTMLAGEYKAFMCSEVKDRILSHKYTLIFFCCSAACLMDGDTLSVYH